MESVTTKTEHETRIEYIERDIREIKGAFQQFIGRNDEQMNTLARSIAQKEGLFEERFVRNDTLKLEFELIKKSLGNIELNFAVQKNELEKVTVFIPMLERIKTEREAVHRIVLEYLMKGVFALFTGGLLVSAIGKFFSK